MGYDKAKVERQAENILNAHYTTGIEIPVDVDLITEAHPNVHDIIPIPFLEANQEVCAILVTHSTGKADILIDDGSPNCPPGRIRFSMAHELGHVVLHPHLWKNIKTLEDAIRLQASHSKQYDLYEWEANYFAAAILMPQGPLWNDTQKIYANLMPQPGSNREDKATKLLVRLANRYEVSIQAMKIRLGNLGWEKRIMLAFQEKKPYLGPSI
jgi:hypothetical protein